MKAPSGYKFRVRTFQVQETVDERGPRVEGAPQALTHLSAIMEADCDLDVEQLVVLALNARGGVIGFKVVGRGTATACVIHPREVFRAAITLGAVHILVAHNHPSGDATPSPEDLAMTKMLREAGQIIGIPVIDHLVLAKTRSGWSARSAA